MKNLIIIMVMLLGSVTNAQTFDFECGTALTPFQSELNDIYSAAEPPTGFVSDGVIETEALTKGGVHVDIVTTFFQKLNSENYGVLALYNIAPVRATLTNGQFVYSPYQNFTIENHNGGKIREWALDIVQALWHLQNPEYNEAIAIAALTIERKAALIALGNVHEDVTVELLLGGNTWFANINYPNIAPLKKVVDPSPRNLDEIGAYSETKYNNFVSAIEAVIDIYTDPIDEAAAAAAELARLAALRTTRINELEGLGNGTPATVVHTYSESNESDSFLVDGDVAVGNPQTFFSSTYDAGRVEYLLDNRYTDLKNAIITKVNELNPTSDYNLKLELEIFYGRSHIDVFNQVNYGDKLPERLETAANNAFDAGLAAQETFIKLLAHGATFRGGDSRVIWDSSNNYYHIVTSNVGEGNGYFDIRLDDNHHYLPGASGTITKTNFRHLAWHTMSNLWHLAGTTAEELVAFRETQLTVYADNNPNKGCTDGCDWRALKGYGNSGVARYIPQFESFGWFLVPGSTWVSIATYQTGITTIDELSLANWADFYDAWKALIDGLV